MKRIALFILLILAFTLTAEAQTCTKAVNISVPAGTTVQLVALVTGRTVNICGFVITGDTLATTAQFQTGTGTTCGTGTVNLTPALRLCDECSIPFGGVTGYIRRGLVSNAVCLAAVTGVVTGLLLYDQ